MMKRLILFFLMVLCMATVSLAQTCRDKNNMTIGKIESDGIVRNASNMKIGSIESNGTVRDASNMKIGSVESNGTVRDGANMKIGSVEGVNQTYAAVFYFFNLF